MASRNRESDQRSNRGRGRGQHPSRGQTRGGLQSRSQAQPDEPQPSSEVTKKEDSILSTSRKSPENQTDIPRRPGYGKQGDHVVVLANYVELTANNDITLYSYDITISHGNQEPQGKKLARIIKLLLNELKEPLYVVTDFARTLVMSKKISNQSFVISYYDENRDGPDENSESYTANIKHTLTLSISDLLNYLHDPMKPYEKEPIVQALNIFLNHYPKASEDYTTIGSSRLFPLNQPGRTEQPGFGLVAAKGYYSSIQLATSRILVNINVTHGAFYKNQNLRDIMKEVMADLSYGDGVKKLRALLRKVRIEHSYLRDDAGKPARRIKTIFDLASEKDGTKGNEKVDEAPIVKMDGARAEEVKFRYEDSYITVFQYFKNVHNKIIDREIPLVNVGSLSKPTYLPPELCVVVAGQRAPMNLDSGGKFRSMAELVGGRSPKDDATDIHNNGVRAIGLSKVPEHQKKRLENFGLRVPNTDLIAVDGRVLPFPNIDCHSGKLDYGRESTWSLAGKQLGPRVSEKRWVCVHIQGSTNINLEDILKRVWTYMKNNGIYIGRIQDWTIKTIRIRHEAYPYELEKIFKDKSREVDFIVIVLPDKTAKLYNCIKMLGDLRYGVATVCVVGQTLQKSAKNPGSLAGNLALKLNLKFNGYNQTVNDKTLCSILDLGETMIVGIDVTHSPIEGRPSIAGMVASVNKKLGQWPAVLRYQAKPRLEMVSYLQEMLETRLRLWRSKNNRCPKNILIYRDGVSEGQYKIVREDELPKLQAACKNFYSKTDFPNITIVIVGKRHHTRFYATPGQSNPKPGTVVDRGITEALNWDFFLQSHWAIKGVARPAHYFVVYDQIFRAAFGADAADKLETFTNVLCFMFGRTTGAVSICTPAYYADLACDRARRYADYEDEPFKDEAGRVAGPVPQKEGDPPGSSGLMIHEKLRDSMFYI